ncbi:unnamed protein product [Hymenolepis diminuta]|uniref:Uncharacterized protein n=1 Tax=Hymenolepis diminuta TaxID=6216 RepID=A0A564XXW6_HYMDI|nr:unnamed protein product [Hymenolepis diminuta]
MNANMTAFLPRTLPSETISCVWLIPLITFVRLSSGWIRVRLQCSLLSLVLMKTY